MNIYYYSHQVYQLSFAIQLYKQLGGIFLVRKLNRKLRLKWYCRKSQRKNAIDSIFVKTPKVVLKNIKKYQSLKIGFALETENGEKNAKDKMKSKDLDYIILNYANEKDAGFESNTNHLYLFSKNGFSKEFELDTKYRLSLDLIKTICNEETA